MGEYAELAIEEEMNAMIEDFPFKKKREFVWHTKNQGSFRLGEMETSHIKNSLQKCKRENWRTFAIPYFEEELKKRGEHNV